MANDGKTEGKSQFTKQILPLIHPYSPAVRLLPHDAIDAVVLLQHTTIP